MDRTFQVTYTPELIRSATSHFWRESGGFRDLSFSSLITAAFVAYVLISGDRSTWVGLMTGMGFAGTTLPVLRYYVYRSSSAEKLRKMGSPEATIRLTDESVGVQSGMGSAEIPWRTVEQVWAFSDVWLVFVGKNNYFTLPTAPMDDEARAFIRQMVTQHGGKVR